MNLLGFKINPKAKLKLFSVILANEIHIAAFAKIDSFVVIVGLKKLVLNEYSAIQRFTYISGNHSVTFDKRAMVGSRCVINAGAGDVEIGEYSALAPRSSIYTHGTFLPATLGFPQTNNSVKIGNYCWIMNSCSIGPGVIIESDSIVLPGSNVVKFIPGNMVVYDTPFERKKFPMDFFRKKLTETELINLIKDITVNYLNSLKSGGDNLIFTINNEMINIKYGDNKNYIIYFSHIGSEILNVSRGVINIFFYLDLDLELMKSRQCVCYDFKRIISSYKKLPELLYKFDEYAFFNYGLKFIDIDYL